MKIAIYSIIFLLAASFLLGITNEVLAQPIDHEALREAETFEASKPSSDERALRSTQDPFVIEGKEVAHKKVFDPFVDIPGVTDQGSLGGLLNGLFQIGIGIAALLAVLMITFGGFRYMTAVTDKGKSSAKEILTSAVFGLVLVIASVLLLSTINPQIVSLNIAVKPLPDVTYGREEERLPPKIQALNNTIANDGTSDITEIVQISDNEGEDVKNLPSSVPGEEGTTNVPLSVTDEDGLELQYGTLVLPNDDQKSEGRLFGFHTDTRLPRDVQKKAKETAISTCVKPPFEGTETTIRTLRGGVTILCDKK